MSIFWNLRVLLGVVVAGVVFPQLPAGAFSAAALGGIAGIVYVIVPLTLVLWLLGLIKIGQVLRWPMKVARFAVMWVLRRFI